jgi:hypothetical protein
MRVRRPTGAFGKASGLRFAFYAGGVGTIHLGYVAAPLG